MDIKDIIHKIKEGGKENIGQVLRELEDGGFETEIKSMAMASAFSMDEDMRLEMFNKLEKDTDLNPIKHILDKTNPDIVRMIDENLNETQQRVLYVLTHNALMEREVAILCPVLIMLERVVKPLIITIKNLTQVIGESKDERG